jgi:hypothetical protein
VWDIARQELRDSLTDLPRIASKLLASEDGRVIAAVHGDEVQFYGRDRPSRGPSSRLRFPSEAFGVAMALSPNGQLFAYATEGTVTLVDVPSGETLGAIETEYGALAGLAFVAVGFGVAPEAMARSATTIGWAKTVAGSPIAFPAVSGVVLATDGAHGDGAVPHVVSLVAYVLSLPAMYLLTRGFWGRKLKP